MPDAAAKMAALPPEVRRWDISDLCDNAQPSLHFSEMRPRDTPHGCEALHRLLTMVTSKERKLGVELFVELPQLSCINST